MPSTQNAVNNHEYQSVAVGALIESPSNPGKRFDEKSIEELAASFKTQGVLAPLLVRELEQSKCEVLLPGHVACEPPDLQNSPAFESDSLSSQMPRLSRHK